jgi:asparagine synthase (glutamine-hydrolysing)
MAAWPEYRRTGSEQLLRPFEHETAYLEKLWEPEDWRWRAKLLVLSDAEKRSLYAPGLAEASRAWSTAEHLHQAFEGLTARDPLNRVLEAELQGIFPDQVLAFVDRLAMAHSLEVRSAYLDTDVVEFVAGLEGHRKIAAGETKHPLKAAARRFFPAEMVDRPKEGFIMPVTEWLLGGLQDYVRDTLSPARLARHGLFESNAVQRLVGTLNERGGDYTDVNKVFVLLVFQEWYDLYMP